MDAANSHALGIQVAIDYAILITWFLAFRFGHGWLYRLHARWFRIDERSFDAIHYSGMALLKILVMVFVLVPWIASLKAG